jgi:hypothetical protein
VSPDVFHQMLDRLGAFVVPYQRALESEAAHYPESAKTWGECRHQRAIQTTR